jgi:hypothetical protein
MGLSRPQTAVRLLCPMPRQPSGSYGEGAVERSSETA